MEGRIDEVHSLVRFAVVRWRQAKGAGVAKGSLRCCDVAIGLIQWLSEISSSASTMGLRCIVFISRSRMSALATVATDEAQL